MGSTHPSQPSSPPIYLCFEEVTGSIHELIFPKRVLSMTCKKAGIDFLENPTSPKLVVQFHEQYSTHTKKKK